jgi:hypothetical protein
MIDVADCGEKSRVLSKDMLATGPLMTWQIPEQPHVKPQRGCCLWPREW